MVDILGMVFPENSALALSHPWNCMILERHVRLRGNKHGVQKTRRSCWANIYDHHFGILV